MTQIFGDYSDNLAASRHHITLTMSAADVPLQWSLCSLSANFLANYFKPLFMAKAQTVDDKLSLWENIRQSVDYVANEMIENAFKHHYDKSVDITVTLGLDKDRIILQVVNTVNPQALTAFYAFLTELEASNPGDLYFSKLEKNAEDPDSKESGLGFLTMINDYEAKLGWKIEALANESAVCSFTTMVQLPVFGFNLTELNFEEKTKMTPIETGDYTIRYNAPDTTVAMTGTLRLNGVSEYAPIVDMLNAALNEKPAILTLDLRQLQFLNSSGINVLSKFVITARQRTQDMTVLGSKKIAWQSKSLQNLQRLMPTLKLVLED